MPYESPKANNLASLARYGRVPPFQVVSRRNTSILVPLANTTQYIVRGCLLTEDQSTSSLAGQGISIGPVTASEVEECIVQILKSSEAVECIIQEFIDGPSGVLFCLSTETALLEYSLAPRGVTSGSANPFAAVFPNSLERYSGIASHIRSLYERFGRCNVELVGIEVPSLVQVRPLSSEFAFDEKFFRLKMHLQENKTGKWLQDEFCLDLAESPHIDGTLIDYYCQIRQELLMPYGIGVEPVTKENFLKIGDQIFIPSEVVEASKLTWRNSLKMGRWIGENYQELVPRLEDRDKSSDIAGLELMRLSFVLRLLYELASKIPWCWIMWIVGLSKTKLLKLRVLCRDRITHVAPRNPLIPSIFYSRKLDSPIIKNADTLEWLRLDHFDSHGLEIIAGDFSVGPWAAFDPAMNFLSHPAYLVTDELYPQLYSHFPYIKGIICEGGSVTSHLAILAREHRMPLWIRVPDAKQRFLDKTNKNAKISDSPPPTDQTAMR